MANKDSSIKHHSKEFFSNDEFDLLEETSGKPYDSSYPDMKKAYQDLKLTYGKVKYWAEELQKHVFPYGKIKITQRPTNQANKFDGYLWAKIYPTAKDLEDKWLAFTVGIDSSGYVIKIDTVGLNDDTITRKKYFTVRGAYDNSEIVLLHSQNTFLDWESLLEQSEKDLRSLLSHYPKIKALRNEVEPFNGIVREPNHIKVSSPLNQILYGPPGTGKTYATKELAVKIASPDFKYDVKSGFSYREQLNNSYKELVSTGQIVFTTFHQSFGYEDFVEGIKPFVEDDNVKYDVKKGVFKEICEKAIKSSVASNFEEVYQLFIDDVSESDKLVLKTPSHKKPFSVKISSNQNAIAIPHTEKATQMTITKEMIRDYMDSGKIRDWKPYTTAIGDYLFKNYNVEVRVDNNRNRNYVLIIDEINRGNVSSIFGELITLLEPDKRSNGKESIEIKLPYSKEPFSVPSNVYLIGTMNTADRSVEAIDTALRRRFSFSEVMPNPKILSPAYSYWDLLWEYRDKEWEDEEYKTKEEALFEFIGADDNLINSRKEIWDQMKKEGRNLNQTSFFEDFQYNGIRLDLILKNINRRVEALLDRDHTIGHSYFIEVYSSIDKKRKLKEIFRDKIIPLLQEYFYGDYSKIGLVLGEAFIDMKEISTDNFFAKSDKFEAIDIGVKYTLKPFTEIDFDTVFNDLKNNVED
ncbi:AAA family ATPase [Flagellimonas marinaquae]|nr:AAA family ATPase [Muricauda sp. UBA7809]UBZ13235.1 AAA family ATPase [Allomuricauda aquimarina]